MYGAAPRSLCSNAHCIAGGDAVRLRFEMVLSLVRKWETKHDDWDLLASWLCSGKDGVRSEMVTPVLIKKGIDSFVWFCHVYHAACFFSQMMRLSVSDGCRSCFNIKRKYDGPA